MVVKVRQLRYNLLRGKSVPLQAWSSPEGSRKLRFQDFVTTAQDGGRLSSLREYQATKHRMHIRSRALFAT